MDGPPAEAAPASVAAPARDRRMVWVGVSLGAAAIAALLVGRALHGERVTVRSVVATTAAAGPPLSAVKDTPKPASAIAASAAPMPIPPGGRLEEARRLVARGDWEQAVRWLEAARAESPDDSEIAYLLATTDLDHRRWSEGVLAATAAVRENPSLKSDPDLIKDVIQSFVGDANVARSDAFLRGSGAAATPFLRDAARHDANAKIRTRATALLAESKAPRRWSSRSTSSLFHR